MSRQKFLHHYLPAHLASALVAGSVLNFVVVETVNFPVSVAGVKTRLRPAVRAQLGKGAYVAIAVLTFVVVTCYWWLAPLTYATTLVSQVRTHKSSADFCQVDRSGSEQAEAAVELDPAFRGEGCPRLIESLVPVTRPSIHLSMHSYVEELPEQANEKRFMLLSTCRVGYAATRTAS